MPSGIYQLDVPITVKSGVELRGAMPTPFNSLVSTTTLITDFGRNSYTGQALITLNSGAGVRGFKVVYNQQDGENNTIRPYSFTIRGNGSNVYVVNMALPNAYQGVDLKTVRCDNAYVCSLSGAILRTGITVGNGSSGVVVRDVQFNQTAFRVNRITQSKMTPQDLRIYLQENYEPFVYENCNDVIHFNDFAYASKHGISIRQNSDVIILGHGSDAAQIAMYITGSQSAPIYAINSQLVAAFAPTEMTYVLTDSTLSGRVNLISTLMWGNPHHGFMVKGGELYASQGIIRHSGNTTIRAQGGHINFNNMYVAGDKTFINGEGGTVNIDANLFQIAKNITGVTNTIYGSDMDFLMLNNCDSITGWQKPSYGDLYIDTVNKTQGQGSLKLEVPSSTGTMHFRLHHNPIDISDYTYLEFDFYIEEPSILQSATDVQIELTSSGVPDLNENNWGKQFINGLSLRSGWNHIRLKLSTSVQVNGGADFSNINFFRFYAVGMDNLGDNVFYRIDNLQFTKLKLSQPDYGLISIDTLSKTYGTSSIRLDANPSSNRMVFAVKTIPHDITQYDFLEFDFFIVNPDDLQYATEGQVELTSSGVSDINEINWDLQMIKDLHLESGWNRICLSISESSGSGGGADLSNINFFRFYILGLPNSDTVVSYRIDNIRFTKAI